MREAIKNDVPDEWRRRAKAGLCPVCAKTPAEFDKGQRIFCSVKCREEYATHYTYWTEVKERILNRDNHSCVIYGINNEKYREFCEKEKKQKFIEWARTHPEEINQYRDKIIIHLDEEFNRRWREIMDDYNTVRSLLNWEEQKELLKGLPDEPELEVDHIKAVALGGDMWDENNMRTLCKACHKAKTKEDKGAMAVKRKNGGTE